MKTIPENKEKQMARTKKGKYIDYNDTRRQTLYVETQVCLQRDVTVTFPADPSESLTTLKSHPSSCLFYCVNKSNPQTRFIHLFR